MTSATASRRIIDEVGSWPGVRVEDGDLGEVGFKVGRREIGHLHGDHAAHFSFPKKVWDELRAQNRIVPHPVFPSARGPAARRIDNDDDIADVIALFRLNYDRLAAHVPL
jgi:hypothetical protein